MPRLRHCLLTLMLIPAACMAAAPMAEPLIPSLGLGAPPARWNDLNPTQKEALQPLAEQWGQLDVARKRKWLGIAQRYAQLSPEEQQRLQARMMEWSSISPAQRSMIRENYATTKGLPVAKSEKWQQYQQLPDEQKKQFAVKDIRKKGAVMSAIPTPNRTLPAVVMPNITTPATLENSGENHLPLAGFVTTPNETGFIAVRPPTSLFVMSPKQKVVNQAK